MKRFMTTVSVLAILAMASSAFGDVYGWTVSVDPVDPYMNTGAGAGAFQTLYLFYACNDAMGMSAAEFDLVPVGIQVLGITTINGFLNAGAGNALLLAVGGCPDGPIAAATILTFDLPGTICFAPSAANTILGTVDCISPVPTLWDGSDWRGYTNDGSICESREGILCEPVSVDDESWGSIKSLYR